MVEGMLAISVRDYNALREAFIEMRKMLQDILEADCLDLVLTQRVRETLKLFDEIST
jgi:hypothetical protein